MDHLKIATKADILDIVGLLEELHTASAYSKTIAFNDVDTYLTVESLLEAPQDTNCIILLYQEGKAVGLIGMSHMTHMFNKSEKTAIELAFWLTFGHKTKSNAKKLLQAYYYWAKKIGCTTILTGSLKKDTEVETYKIKRIT